LTFVTGVNTRCEPFMPIDLYEEKNIPYVVNYLLGFEKTAVSGGFKIALKRIDTNMGENRFTEAQLIRAQESLKMQKGANLNELFHHNASLEVESAEEEQYDEEDSESEEEDEPEGLTLVHIGLISCRY
jgi:hypothetical protein